MHKLTSYARKPWLHCAVLLICGILVRFPALQGELIWDDLFLARDNPLIKSPVLLLETFRHYLLIDSYSSHYRPVQNISYMLDYFFWNTNWYGYHLSNVLWHVGSGVLLYFLLKQLLPGLSAKKSREGQALVGQEGKPWITAVAFMVSLLWVIHPVHSAAVDYISGRADSLAFFFASASWLLFLRAKKISQSKWSWAFHAVAAGSALLALCSRESALMWLCVFFLYLFGLERTWRMRTKITIAVVCLAIVGVYAGCRRLPGPRVTNNPTSEWTAPVRGTLMLRALGDYGRLMLFPANLHMERSLIDPLSNKGTRGWREAVAAEYLSILGLLVAAILGFGACRRGEFQRLRVFGAGWFILAYLPISNLVELNATVAEHWIYLPSVGFLLFLAGCYLDFPLKLRRLAYAVSCVAVLGLGARSFVRSSDWQTAEGFYQRTLAAGGTSVRIALNLGQVYSARGENAKAEALFRGVLVIAPDFLIARNNLGSVLQLQGKIKEADAVFEEAGRAANEQRQEFPRTWMAALNLAHMQIANKDNAAALKILVQARQTYPGTWQLISLEAEVRRTMNDLAPAIQIVGDFSRANWWHGSAAIALGRLYAEQGDVVRSEAALRQASRLDVHDAEALNLLAQIRVRQNRLADAFTTQRRAIARQPDEPSQYLLLSDILQKMGRAEDARAILADATRLQTLANGQVAAN